MRINAAVGRGLIVAGLSLCASLAFAVDAPLTEGQKLEKEVKQLMTESDRLLMTEKGYTRDSKAVEEGIKKLERAEELAAKASEIDPDKYDKLAQTVAMKLYGARKNTTLHLADTPRKTVASAPPVAKPAVPVTPTPPAASTTPPVATPATTPPANTPPWPPEAPAVGTVKTVADATKPATPNAPATPAPETATRRTAAPEAETPSRRNADAPPETSTRRTADATVSEGAARRAREAAAAAEQPQAPTATPVAAPPVVRREKVFTLKDGRKIVAQRVFDTETEHVIKDIAGKMHTVLKEEVAQVIEQDTVIGAPAGTVAAPAKRVTVYTLKDGRTINAVKILDVGEQLSIKDDKNRFIVIEKADVVDPKL